MENEKRLIDYNKARAVAQRIYSDPVLVHAILNTLDNTPTVKAVPVDEILRVIAGHSNYHGDNILSALICIAEGKKVNPVRPLEKVDAVEVVHGRWLPDMEEFDDDPAVGIRGGVYQTGWKCSICGRSEQAKEPFCNCGAKMDGGNEDG